MIRYTSWPRAASFLALLAAAPAFAADLGSGTISTSSRTLTITEGPYLTSNPSAAAGFGELMCDDAAFRCDTYGITVELPAAYVEDHPNARVRIAVAWDDPAQGPAGVSPTDFDIFLQDGAGNDVGGNGGATSANPEFLQIVPVAGSRSFRLQIVPYTVAGQSITAVIELQDGPVSTGGGDVTLGGPAFENHVAPGEFANWSADEPTIGLDRNTGDAFMIFSLNQARVQFDDTTSPPGTTWTDVADPLANLNTADPFLTDDPYPLEDGSFNPRIWIAQLQAVNSIIGFTDDAGESWTVSQGGGQPHGADNQSIAAGPYPAGARPPLALAEHAFYYCSHAAVNAFCSRSDDGGLTFNPSRPIFPLDGLCSNHGHVKVGADGTVYVPMNNTCEGSEGVAISIDAGETWHYIGVPNTAGGRWDSSIGIASDGRTLYYGYGEAGDDRALIIKGTLDKSTPTAPTINWDPRGAVDVGAPAGLANIVFPTVVAGDPDRAAFAFHGTITDGDSGDPAAMAAAEWYLYVATTLDGGANWQLRLVTPNDPTQKGAVCDHGTTCATEDRPPDRNLLDFMGMVVDAQGRLVIGYADGCTDGCVLPTAAANYAARGVIARQTGGKRMFAAFDPDESGLPGAPFVTGARLPSSIVLNWGTPSLGGSDLVEYRIYRAVNAGPFALFGTSTLPKFTDLTAVRQGTTYRYRVSAVNAAGEGPQGNEVAPVELPASLCLVPGRTVLTDPAGDILALGPDHPVDPESIDLRRLSVAQPWLDGRYAFVFSLRVQSLDVVPPGVVWPVEFDGSNGRHWEVHMSTLGSPTPVFELCDDTGACTPADAASGYTPDGEIRIIVDAAALGLSAPGTDTLGNFISRILLGAITPDNMPDSLAPAGSVDSLPGLYCAPNTAPVAAVGADVSSGAGPLSVQFDGSASSDPDSFDDVVRWVWNFGDGSPEVATDTPTVTHVFNAPGLYGVKLEVVDGRDLASGNTALVQVQVFDLTPDAFAFGPVGNAFPGSLVVSGPVLIGGFDGPTAVVVANGRYRIGANGRWQTSPGTLRPGEVIEVSHWTSFEPDAVDRTTLSVGGVSAIFRSRNRNADVSPDAFHFALVENAAPGALVESNVLVPAGFDAPALISLTRGAEYRVNGGEWTAKVDHLKPGQSIQVRFRTAAVAGAQRRITLKLGATPGRFVVRNAP